MQTSPEQNGQQTDARDRLTRLQALTASLLEAVTSEQVADASLTHSLSVLGAHAGVIYRLSEDGTEFVCLRMAGYPAELADAWGRFPADARTPVGMRSARASWWSCRPSERCGTATRRRPASRPSRGRHQRSPSR